MARFLLRVAAYLGGIFLVLYLVGLGVSFRSAQIIRAGGRRIERQVAELREVHRG